ncbi:hypothetical protein D5S17_28745 [Pseudonocardiaceae bacterium YIM PH 21723]|nr:hypothetical protein D5S17_28745 [Pseudonocardiaceae bacterium YIM PH 21723]
MNCAAGQPTDLQTNLPAVWDDWVKVTDDETGYANILREITGDIDDNAYHFVSVKCGDAILKWEENKPGGGGSGGAGPIAPKLPEKGKVTPSAPKGKIETGAGGTA